jgi:hypothetical protein
VVDLLDGAVSMECNNSNTMVAVSVVVAVVVISLHPLLHPTIEAAEINGETIVAVAGVMVIMGIIEITSEMDVEGVMAI